MISLRANVDLSHYAARAKQLLSLLGPAAKTDMHDACATEVVELLRTHIRAYAASHHDTADNIRSGPATRTGHLEDAAASVAKGSITSDSGEVTISSPGFRRALGTLTIVPDKKPFLTVPIHAVAYGKTVSDLIDQGLKIFRIRRKKDGKKFISTISYGKKLLVLYALKDEVTLKHAPDLLPSSEEFREAARTGVLGVVTIRLGKRGAA